MNKDTVLKSDIEEIIRVLRDDMIEELEASKEKMEQLGEEGEYEEALKEGSRSSGFVQGVAWTIKNLELNI